MVDSFLINMIDLDSLDGINIINDLSEFRALALESVDSSTLTPKYSSMSQKDANLLTCMMITANVGTIFEEVSLSKVIISSSSNKFHSIIGKQPMKLHAHE